MRRVLIVSADRTGVDGAAINLGDALLTDALAIGLTDAGFEVTIADFGGERHDTDHARTFVSGVWGLMSRLRQVDALVIGGGTLLQDDTPNRFIGGLPRLLLVSSVLARLMRRRVAFFAVGCDPIERRMPRLLLRFALHMGPAWVRDSRSRDRCRRMFGKRVALAADASLLMADRLAQACRRTVKDTPGSIVLALNAREAAQLSPDYVAQLEAGIREARFVAMSRSGDFDDAARLSPETANVLKLDPSPSSWPFAVAAISASSVVIASRMHALYIAAMAGVPMAGVGNSAKVEGFAAEFGVPIFSKLPRAIEAAQETNAASLQGAVTRARDGLRQLITFLD